MKVLNTEYAPFYANYIKLATDFNLNSSFENQREVMLTFFKTIPLDKLDYRYEPHKWSVKDILLHLIDSERIFAYRALRIGRNDKTPLPGFEENDYAISANATNRSLNSLLEEYISVRNATITLFNSFDQNQLMSIGEASGKEISVRALGYIILGHEMHHINIIKERYL